MSNFNPYISPQSGEPLFTEEDKLKTAHGEAFPVINDIPRFVSNDNYASAFGLQWKTFSKTQLDSFSQTNISRSRLERCLGFSVNALKGLKVLEVGCGAGRFTELLVEGGAYVHSVDLSEAVETNKENIGNAPNYKIAQASVYELPFENECFDIVLCLGVIQHTPSTEKTIEALWKKLKPGGLLVIDHYKWRIGYYSTITPLVRMILKEMPPHKSQKVVNKLVKFFFPLHWKFKGKGVFNWLLHRVSPLIQYIQLYPDQDYKFHYEWSKLDTYDQLTDYYKRLKTPRQILKILAGLGGKEIWVHKGGNGIEARCRK